MQAPNATAFAVSATRRPEQWTSIVDALRWRAEQQPTDRAFTLLEDGSAPGSSLTYQELDRQARAIAAFLQARLEPGERVLLSFPQGTAFIAAFFGCLYARMIAVPAPLPDGLNSKRTLIRLRAMATDAQPGLLLSAIACRRGH